VATTGAARAREKALPRSATITIRAQKPHPAGEVEVTPDSGTIRFLNKDKHDYRLRFWRVGTPSGHGIDMLLPGESSLTVLIKKGDEFDFSVMRRKIDNVLNGQWGGPIKN
jgi:hypothetical protein